MGWGKLVLIAAAIAFLAIAFKPLVSADGGGYFAYLHSVVVDHDLDMTDEYAAGSAAHVHLAGGIHERTVTGLPPNQFAVGPAILSLPAYLIALLIRPSGEPQFGPPFTFAFTLASLFFGCMALALAYRFVRRLDYSQDAGLVAVAAIAITTPLLYYLVYSPSYSHTFSAFMVTAFVYLWWTRRDQRTIAGWLVLGLVAGVMALVRWQDGALAAIALLDFPRARWRVALMVPGALLAFTPQFVVDEVIFGKLMPGAPSVSFSPFPGHYFDVLFSSLHGLFIWSPVFLAAVAGYWFVKDRTLRIAFALCFLIDLAVIGAFVYWYGGFSFGMRFFINLTPFWAIGLAALATRLRPVISWAAVALLGAWNFVLVLSFTYTLKGDVAPGYAGLLQAQLHSLTLLPHLVQGYVARGLLLRGGDVVGASVLLVLEALIVVAAFGYATAPERLRRQV